MKLLKFLLMIALGIVGAFLYEKTISPILFPETNISSVISEEKKEVVIEENTAIIEAVEKTKKSVLAIRSKTKTGKVIEGCGLIVSSDGLVVTFNDLLPANSTTIILWEGKSPSFQILKRDQENNLALLKIDETNLPTVGFSSLSSLRTGQRVFLVGTIFPSPSLIANEGVIKSVALNLFETNIIETYNLKSAPLFNVKGEVVGLVQLDSAGRVSALPIDTIRSFIGF